MRHMSERRQHDGTCFVFIADSGTAIGGEKTAAIDFSRCWSGRFLSGRARVDTQHTDSDREGGGGEEGWYRQGEGVRHRQGCGHDVRAALPTNQDESSHHICCHQFKGGAGAVRVCRGSGGDGQCEVLHSVPDVSTAS